MGNGATTIGALLHERAAEHPDREYMRCGGVSTTYAEIAARIDRIAAGLAAAGVGPGTIMAVLAGNRQEFVELFLSCTRAGIIEVPLNAFLKGDFLRYQLDNSTANAIAVDAAGYDSIRPLLPTLPDLTTIVCFDAPPPDASTSGRLVISFDELRNSGATFSAPDLAEDDLAALLYTSGTTGLPKGCMITHGYGLRFATRWAAVMDLQPHDVQHVLYPMFHASTQIAGVVSPLVAGCTGSFELEFSPQAFAQRIVDVGATKVAGIGAHAVMILAQPPSETERLHRVQAMFYAPCPATVRAEMAARFGAVISAKLYGQTECCPLTYSPLDDWSSENPTSCGRAAPDLEVAIFDEHDQPVPAGAAGEIVARPLAPHALFAGYWRNPDVTAAAFRDGWYHTGDAGALHADGTLSFVDRKKDVIRRRGENISSLELESAILALPGIADVAVFAIKSAELEDEVMATITLRDGVDVSPETLFASFKQHLPYFAVPRYVDLGGEIPRNALNRVMKNVLQERGVTESTWDFSALGLVVGKRERRGAA